MYADNNFLRDNVRNNSNQTKCLKYLHKKNGGVKTHLSWKQFTKMNNDMLNKLMRHLKQVQKSEIE